jgi:5-hydroxyisourate hydrolase
MSSISTHVLDTSKGAPAAGLPITLERGADGAWSRIGGGVTNDDGRVAKLLNSDVTFGPGTYRMTFETSAYFTAENTDGFYPIVRVEFTVRSTDQHYHVPLLLSPFGYSTYRGS